MTKVDAYQSAGVNVDAGNEAAKRYAQLARSTQRPEVLGGIGGFSGGFHLNLNRHPNPVLVSGTDGVGTKLKIAFATDTHDSIGIDCVAMCVNDILTSGAEPLFFLDYLAVGTLDVNRAAAVVAGVAEGCMQAGCTLIGGETAEMPGMYSDGEYDLAGTVVGVVNRDNVIDGSQVSAGDVLLGLASNGVHSNGYSLVRKLIDQAGLGWTDSLPGWRGTIADELLRPTRIYVKSVLAALEAGVTVHAMAHITGGGLVDNIPRVLPEGCEAVLDFGAWEVPAVFEWLINQGKIDWIEAARIWNLGIGYVLIVPAEGVDEAAAVLRSSGETVCRIGEVAQGSAGVRFTRAGA